MMGGLVVRGRQLEFVGRVDEGLRVGSHHVYQQ